MMTSRRAPAAPSTTVTVLVLGVSSAWPSVRPARQRAALRASSVRQSPRPHRSTQWEPRIAIGSPPRGSWPNIATPATTATGIASSAAMTGGHGMVSALRRVRVLLCPAGCSDRLCSRQKPRESAPRSPYLKLAPEVVNRSFTGPYTHPRAYCRRPFCPFFAAEVDRAGVAAACRPADRTECERAVARGDCSVPTASRKLKARLELVMPVHPHQSTELSNIFIGC